MTEYKGSDSLGARQALLEKRRQQMMDDLAAQRRQIEQDNKLRIGKEAFVSASDEMEARFKESTIGLMKLEDFRRVREELELEKAREAARTAIKKEDKVKKRKKKAQSKPLVSFDMEEGEEEARKDELKKIKLAKNPHVDTSFLPDRKRDEEEKRQREELRLEWLRKQEEIKNEVISVTYSYWDGAGHRYAVECKKGDTIGKFLDKCREQVHDIRGVKADNLLYIKEDLIIPHHYTFYEFIANKTRGKSGPLFSFDVHDDIRLTNDARVEKEESHAGKVVERSWYERNKHIFPASRWETFDPEKDYGSYSIKDKKP